MPREDSAAVADGAEVFDDLLYAQERALLFWGDCLGLGVLTPEEVEGLEKGLVSRIKVIG